MRHLDVPRSLVGLKRRLQARYASQEDVDRPPHDVLRPEFLAELKRLDLRAKALLLADKGLRNVEIAKAVGIGVRTITIWRREFLERGTDSVKERRRSGRPRAFPPEVRAAATHLACQKPETPIPLDGLSWAAKSSPPAASTDPFIAKTAPAHPTRAVETADAAAIAHAQELAFPRSHWGIVPGTWREIASTQ